MNLQYYFPLVCRIKRFAFLCLVCMLGVGCATSPPKHLDDVCKIFEEKGGWYKDAKKASERWSSDIPVIMSIIHQESRFVSNAKPPRRKFLWIFPGPRKSDAYGYAQAKKATWREYQSASRRWGADRNDFVDAADFVAWYNHQSSKQLGIASTDAHKLYLAYHEGRGGFKRGSYKSKPWLIAVANKVANRSWRYRTQLKKCEEDLDSSWWWPFS